MADPSALASYRRALARVGKQHTVVIRSVRGAAPNVTTFDAEVPAIVRDMSSAGEQSAGAIGAMKRNMRRLIVMEDDLRARRFPLPVTKNDKAVVDGHALNITAVDRNKRQFAGAIELEAEGV